jgi:hypothetical protein
MKRVRTGGSHPFHFCKHLDINPLFDSELADCGLTDCLKLPDDHILHELPTQLPVHHFLDFFPFVA